MRVESEYSMIYCNKFVGDPGRVDDKMKMKNEILNNTANREDETRIIYIY